MSRSGVTREAMEMENSPGSQVKHLDQEALGRTDTKKGGWITLPFIAGSMLGLGLAINATTSNLLIYLLKKYNVESIDAAQIANIVRGSLNLVPLAGAVISDSYLGCFPVVLAGTAVTVLSFVLFTLSAALPSLRPTPCTSPGTAGCQHATPGQLAVLYSAVCLLAIGTGGTRFNVATMGADQFGSARDQDTFFNWYFVFLYTSFIIGDTAVVYLQDGISWTIGFGVCLATTAASFVLLLLGARYYKMPAPKGSPYTELARVVVAAVRKPRVNNVGAVGPVQYYVGDGAVTESDSDDAPSKRLRFLNRAAMVTGNDRWRDTSRDHQASRWQLCTVQQVEDLKSLLGILPIWSSGILVSVSIGVMVGMVTLEALAMDRSLGPHFNIPAGSIGVGSMIAFIVATPILERGMFPLWHKVTGSLPTPLQRVGLGHLVNIVGIVSAALVEQRRLAVVHAHHGLDQGPGWVTPMSVLWLLFPIGIVGIGEALHFPGNMAFYYLEFPKTLRSTATAMAPLLIALGFYISTVFVDIVRRVTAWLPGNINQGRVDNVFWAVAAVAAVNFGYFLVCVSLYKARK